VTEFTTVHATEPAPRVSRRTLFAGAGTAGALAAAAALLPRTPTPAAQVAAAAIEPAGDGYQLTEHVQHYYRTARI
jgi:ATP-dependent protease HslVU (ClpYQ) peptidase subunit